jgi:hypothetical protein
MQLGCDATLQCRLESKDSSASERSAAGKGDFWTRLVFSRTMRREVGIRGRSVAMVVRKQKRGVLQHKPW